MTLFYKTFISFRRHLSDSGLLGLPPSVVRSVLGPRNGHTCGRDPQTSRYSDPPTGLRWWSRFESHSPVSVLLLVRKV